jgi:hypothetical protein
MSPPAQHLVLTQIESTFLELAADPRGTTLGGTSLGGWLPVPELQLRVMRNILLHPPHPDAVPSIWKELISRFRQAADPES